MLPISENVLLQKLFLIVAFETLTFSGASIPPKHQEATFPPTWMPIMPSFFPSYFSLPFPFFSFPFPLFSFFLSFCPFSSLFAFFLPLEVGPLNPAMGV